MLSILQSLSVKNCPLKRAMTPSLRNTFGWNPDTLDSGSELTSATHSILSAWLPQCSRGRSPLVYVHAKSLQLQPTLCDPTDCSPSDYSVHGILQARMLESVAISLPGDLLDPGIGPSSQASPILVDGFFTTNTTWASHSPLTAFRSPS